MLKGFAFLVFVVILAGSTSAQEALQVKEKVFQETALKIQELLTSDPFTGTYAEIDKRLSAKQPELQEYYTSLTRFPTEAPDSVYADDALLVLAAVAGPENKLKYLQALMNQYAEGRLEPWSVENLSEMLPLATKSSGELKMGALARFEYAQELSSVNFERYKDSSREMWSFLGEFEKIEESDISDVPQIALAYMTLARNYLSQGDNEGAKKVYQDALSKLPEGGLREHFAKELGKLGE